MAMNVAAPSRAPRGTKVLIQAFFSAAEEIPAGSRDTVIKAALAGIRDQLKAAHEKAKAAREKAKSGGMSAAGGPNAAGKKSAINAAKRVASARPTAKKAAKKAAAPLSRGPKKTAAKRGQASAPPALPQEEHRQDQTTEAGGDTSAA